MLYTNVDGFLNKKDELQLIIGNSSVPHVIVLTEMIPKGQKHPILACDIKIPGYHDPQISFDLEIPEPGRNGKRGVAMYIVENISDVEEVEIESDISEAIGVCIKLANTKKLLIVGVYRSPSANGYESTQEICTLLEEISKLDFDHILIVGDFNYPEIDWERNLSRAGPNHFSSEFLQATQENLLWQMVDEPTRFRSGQCSNILDLVLTNDEGFVEDMRYLSPVGLSDHLLLSFAIRCRSMKDCQVANSSKNYHKGNYEKANTLISQTDWSVLNENTIEHSWNFFKTKIEEICNDTVPVHVAKKKRNIFMNREALALKKKKDKSFHKYRKSNLAGDLQKYKKKRNELRTMTRKLRIDFEKKLASDLKNSSKPFWRYCKTRMKSQGKIGKLEGSDGKELITPEEKVQELNAFFTSVFTNEDLEDLPIPEQVVNESLDHVSITREKVKQKLLHLNVTKTPGPDGIHPRFLRETAEELSLPLSIIFKESLESGKMPSDWKSANITPIHKKGSKKSAENYRPISLTSQVCKILESIIRDDIMTFFSTYGVLSEAQHGFVPGRSCVSQLLTVLEDWTRCIDAGTPLDTVYLDFKKAFDSVAHRRLIITLETLGIRGKLLKWIEDFLTERLQRVVLEGQASEWTRVTSGVPQGSILGPILFIAAVHSLPESVKSSVAIYADDTKLYRPIASQEDTEVLQNDLDALVAWSARWQLPFNTAKCKVMHIGATNPDVTYTMAGHVLEETAEERDLGLIVDKDLLFHSQSAAAVAKAFRTLGIIKRTFMHLDEVTLPLLFKTMVRPILEYGNCVWGPVFCGDQDRIERVQRRATKMIPAIRHLPYQERLERLRLPSMHYRRIRGDMIMVYQLYSGKIRIDPSTFFKPSPANSTTRGHCKKLLVPSSRKVSRQRFFSVRVVNSWNHLPEDIVTAESINSFKNKLDKYWKEKMYRTRVDT